MDDLHSYIESPGDISMTACVTHFACADALREYGDLSPEELEQRTLSERFSAIHNIKASINLRYPKSFKPTETSLIDEDEIVDEVVTLSKLASSIQLNDDYHAMVMHVTREAVKALTDSVQDMQRLMNWATLSNQDRETFLVRLHNAIIYQTQLFFGEDTPLGQAFQSAKLNGFEAEGLRLNIDGTTVKNVLGGYIQNKSGIHINYHPDANIQDLFEAFDTVAHETAHIIEEIVKGYTGDTMQAWFYEAREVLREQDKCRAYIPSRLPTPYRLQCNEDVAFDAGDTAQDQLAQAIVGPWHLQTPPSFAPRTM